MILFLSHYPDKVTIKDGMSQRISNIDAYFSDDERVYLNISIRNFLKKKIFKEDKSTFISCNLFIHFFEIYKYFLQAEKVYIHSIYNTIQPLFLINLIKKDYILDLHGVVPEENLLEGKKMLYHLYNFCEYILFKRAKHVICVTESMKKHYTLKFPKSKTNYIIFPILPNTIIEDFKVLNFENREQLVNIVYSGNTQKWQNIELMSKIISENLFPHIKYYILTGNVASMKKIIEKEIAKTHINQIEILSVNPERLNTYYEKCHYGFILRDDILVNNVSCPTKLIEYMHFGITPIILSPEIGDSKQYGFEYINCEESFRDLLPLKSIKNNMIIKQMISTKENINFRNAVLS